MERYAESKAGGTTTMPWSSIGKHYLTMRVPRMMTTAKTTATTDGSSLVEGGKQVLVIKAGADSEWSATSLKLPLQCSSDRVSTSMLISL